ncbi:hypothetical protein QN277_028818 [Acacia crassicarpa]|uniref:RNase H type-1 domain-containing protein n=1 Tax=Acacia crassicarpa TaxID=499986 RepID=A0AAE1MDK4_9FABA|nr:hypothetical protein QN277_028818 [Acacia crassicarpa]
MSMSLPTPTVWVPLPIGWINVNMDGAVARWDRKARCGGVIRGHKGEWLLGFSQPLGLVDVDVAEEWAVLMGLCLAWDEGHKKVMVEFDSKLLVARLLDSRQDFNNSSVFIQIRLLLSSNWEVKLQHVCRSQNTLAYAMAKEGISFSYVSSVCPHFLKPSVFS